MGLGGWIILAVIAGPSLACLIGAIWLDHEQRQRLHTQINIRNGGGE